MTRRILICEDEAEIVSFVKQELEHEGYAADAAADGVEALQLFSESRYDLVLLDIMLPKRNGLEVLRAIRKTNNVPVLILTARKEVYDKVAFLDAGADDYITKPFDTLELLARIRRVFTRDGAQTPRAVTVDEPGCRVCVHGQALPLTKTEFDIFACLYRREGAVLSRDDILHAVYGAYYGESNTVDVNIANIRRKLAVLDADGMIETVRGRGYVLRCAE